ncbi:response regulator transcription factor [Rheinheimera muenzenbergensis]|uniref:Response regulator transcription factor n=1 Tax=Rheinheimera muenzenbergensis TaxID=1193628 RepID=A0ABU8CB76_9GAMM|nr:response regulator transcription factor [Gammaproteobacteria bacterium]MBU1554851.1 response regulator transcription factor [Gammaproteobacteria bacterium]MBU2071802.1 response regulator transcription factor [Gammaproteobacteria bacterium]MBU2184130.1 response regulator transcription factor [Gammaproteobacteria bacterium]MBU2204283.1 response regulator transcription factor [Gammaproteobacteria bacterium]
MRLLVVEDENLLAQQIKEHLMQQQFSVDVAFDGDDGWFKLSEYPYDLAIIDIGLPKMDGLTVIRKARQAGIKTPIIILTARGSWQEKVEGLDAGADDYLTKPFHSEELLARCNALIRRAAGQPEPTLSAGPVSLNSRTQQVWCQNEEVSLTAYEYKVLEYFMLNPNKVISKTELTEHIYDQDFDLDSNVIEVFVLRLRKKLDPNGELKPIETLRGRGYRFTLTVS